MPTSAFRCLTLAALLASSGRTDSTGPSISLSTPVIATSSKATPSTCASGTLNYITHSLPQQCLHSSWSTSIGVPSGPPTTIDHLQAPPVETQASVAQPTAHLEPPNQASSNVGTFAHTAQADEASNKVPDATSQTNVPGTSSSSPIPATDTSSQPESENDSPLDDAKFLSFEDWKQQNLAQAGQSAENVGKAGAQLGETPTRRLPGVSNALDTLGDDTEIDIDFSGFKAPLGPSIERRDRLSDAVARDKASDTLSATPSAMVKSRNKDAGKTCKERFNYASFDCAANVLKTNPECKSASSVLIEHKDSYMLNECSATNKFVIVELCEHIHIDTVVLANFEFFSSMFQTFRVSVSDRYPVKIDRWKELGTYAARNAREIQAFLVEEPQMWARYLRVEFLTHYGNEYYCPLSLLRVHGTTMMEEFRQEEEAARGELDVDDDGISVLDHPEDTVSNEAQIVQSPLETKPSELAGKSGPTASEQSDHEAPTSLSAESVSRSVASKTQMVLSTTKSSPMSDTCSYRVIDSPFLHGTGIKSTCHSSGIITGTSKTSSSATVTSQATPIQAFPHDSKAGASSTPLTDTTMESPQVFKPQSNANLPDGPDTTDGTSQLPNDSSPQENAATTRPLASTPVSNQTTADPTSVVAPTLSSTPAAVVPPPPSSSPATQESFFKSINKRLQALEANTTLSLQYIESQSQLLRDAFTTVERRNLAKTSTFLATLNSTVLTELARFKGDYEQLWQSTVLELASQREEGRREREVLSDRVRMLADEMVSHKRLMAAQATLLLLCLGLVVFARAAPAVGVDTKLVQGVDDLRRRTLKGSEALGRRVWHWDANQRSPWATPPRSSPSTRPGTAGGHERDQSDSNEEADYGDAEVQAEHAIVDFDDAHKGYLDPSSAATALPTHSKVAEDIQQTQSAPTTPQFDTAPIFTNEYYEADDAG
ncbi:MAG: hypothetical protein M1828_005190 [Chrysothrix sp. TS-e1954]|nr:MAG: hypothetical protein M1828_005190 [Chrysothrix sp. TS-e1954]